MFLNLNYFKFYIYIAIIYAITFYFYFFFTKFQRVIIIKEDFIVGINKQILNLISDTNNNLYVIDNKFLLLNFDAAETLSKLEKGKSYRVTGYGIRIPFFDMYQNITTCTLVV
jgi:hypothetical protein